MKKLPTFRNENAERAFWTKNSPLDFMAAKKLRPTVFPNLQISSQTISIRLPGHLLETVKVLAAKKGVPYQAMFTILLEEAVKKEQITQRDRHA